MTKTRNELRGGFVAAVFVAFALLVIGCGSGETANDCGNGTCESGETAASCPADCGSVPVCDNGVCESGETAASCPADCGSGPVCDNGVCESGETAASCPADCGASPVCDNGVCESGETAASCPVDCGGDTTPPNLVIADISILSMDYDIRIESGSVDEACNLYVYVSNQFSAQDDPAGTSLVAALLDTNSIRATSRAVSAGALDGEVFDFGTSVGNIQRAYFLCVDSSDNQSAIKCRTSLFDCTP